MRMGGAVEKYVASLCHAGSTFATGLATKAPVEPARCAFQLAAIADRSKKTFYAAIVANRWRAAKFTWLRMAQQLLSDGPQFSNALTHVGGNSTAESISVRSLAINKMPRRHIVHGLRML